MCCPAIVCPGGAGLDTLFMVCPSRRPTIFMVCPRQGVSRDTAPHQHRYHAKGGRMLAYNNNGLKGRTFHAVMTGVVVILLSLAAAGMARADNSPTAPPAWQASCVAPSRAAPADCRMEQRL